MMVVWVAAFVVLVAVTGGLFAVVERLQNSGQAAETDNFASAETTFVEAFAGVDRGLPCGGIQREVSCRPAPCLKHVGGRGAAGRGEAGWGSG